MNENQKVNKGKSDVMFNTESLLKFSEIQQDTMIMKDGGIKGIIKVSGVNIDLQESGEIEILIEKYKRFLNGLEFPLQIIVRNNFLDLTAYLTYIKDKASVITNRNLKRQSDSYINYLENINLQQGLIFVKNFYLVVSYYTPMQGDIDGVKKARWKKLVDSLDAKDSAEKIVKRYRDFLKNKEKLDTRCRLVMDGLHSMSLSPQRLQAKEIVSLLFNYHNPTVQESQSHPLR